MNSSIYDIDHDALATELVPKVIRNEKMVAWVKCLVYPVSLMYQVFLRFRTAKNYELGITPQVCYLEKLLNDRWDAADRTIEIVDGQDKPPTYFYKRAESKPVYFRKRSEDVPVVLYTRGESGAIQDDFVILVPYAIIFNEAEMRSLVKVYKLAGTKFKIQRV
jgi:hypothetical protein